MTNNLLPPKESLLTYLAIDSADVRSISPPWKRTRYQAILNWLTRYQPKPNAPNLEQVRGCLEAISLFCDLEDWTQAEKIFMLCLNTPTNEELHNQLATWGYYREQIQLYERFLDQSDPLLKALCLSGLGNA